MESEPKQPTANDTSIDTDIVHWKWKVNYESNILETNRFVQKTLSFGFNETKANQMYLYTHLQKPSKK